MNKFNLFLVVLLVHLLYDFHWQGPFVAEMKGKSLFILNVHAWTWALCVALTLYLARGQSLLGPALPFLFGTHYVTDWWKARLPQDDEHWKAIYLDQLIHVATLAVVVWFAG